jgi:transcriptional repressor NrdR
MQCPRCHYIETKVTDSRDVDNNTTIRRRRECLGCGTRFTTFERVGFTELMVIKRDNTKELYNRDKLKKSIMLAFAKRNKIDIEDIQNLISNLEVKWLEQGNEISSHTIGEDVVDALKDLDFVAYIRFASVYKQFKTIDDFKLFIS